MKRHDPVSPSELRKLLRYESQTGKLFWKPRTSEYFSNKAGKAAAICKMWNTKFAGKEALTATDDRGYKRGSIFNRSYEAHRVCFAISSGSWPTLEIDHINGNPSDNRIENLREASREEQCRNSAMPTTNKSGVVGVCWDQSRKRWAAFIHLNDKIRHLGRFQNFDDAVRIRKEAEIRNGFHPNHGRAAA